MWNETETDSTAARDPSHAEPAGKANAATPTLAGIEMAPHMLLRYATQPANRMEAMRLRQTESHLDEHREARHADGGARRRGQRRPVRAGAAPGRRRIAPAPRGAATAARRPPAPGHRGQDGRSRRTWHAVATTTTARRAWPPGSPRSSCSPTAWMPRAPASTPRCRRCCARRCARRCSMPASGARARDGQPGPAARRGASASCRTSPSPTTTNAR